MENTPALLPILEKSECGECTACCTVMSVKSLHKPENSTCQHVCKTGCGIYEKRPTECGTYECFWLKSASTKLLRPDKLGVIFDIGETKFGPTVYAREVWSGAFANDMARQLAVQLSIEYDAVLLVTSPNGNRRMLFPKHKEHLAKASARQVEANMNKRDRKKKQALAVKALSLLRKRRILTPAKPLLDEYTSSVNQS